MAASDHLFMPAKMLRELDLEGDVTLEDEAGGGYLKANRDRYSTEDAFWQRKSDEAFDSGIYKSIKRHGIVNPVELKMNKYGKPYIVNGFHRVAAAHDIDPSWFVPVTYKPVEQHRKDELPQHWNRVNETYVNEENSR